jgi:hypothetical protein
LPYTQAQQPLMDRSVGPTSEDGKDRRSRFSARLVLWAGFVTACLLFGASKVAQNEQYWAACRVRQREQQDLITRARAAQQRVRAILWDERRTEPWTRRDLEAKLNQGKPFVQEQGDGEQKAIWADPASGQRWELKVRDGELRGYHMGWGTADVLRQLPPVSRATYEDAREQIRRSLPRYGVFCWCILLILLAALRRHRRAISECLLAVAMLCNLAWLVNPNYSVSLRGITSNDMLFFGVLMLVASIGVTAWVRPGPLRPQFGLATLLAVMTLCAVLFAMGKFGFLVFFAAVVGAGLYLFVRLLSAASRADTTWFATGATRNPDP